MPTSFDLLPDHARVWVYQADRPLTDAEVAAAYAWLTPRLAGWNSHGAELRAAATIFYNRLVVLGVDEALAAPSGCAIDASVGWLRELGAGLGVDFFDRSVAFWVGDALRTLSLSAVKTGVAEGLITPETVVFNNAVTHKMHLENGWQGRAENAWLARYFAPHKVIN